MPLRRLIKTIFWRPAGWLPSLESLDASHGAIAKCDVTELIGGQNAEPYPLTVVELANGKIIGNLRMVATAGDVVVMGLQSVANCTEPENEALLRRRFRFRLPKYQPGRTLVLGTGIHGNYYHWMMDSLPRWKILQAAGYSDYDFVLVPGGTQSYEKEMLDRLGIPPEKRLLCSRNRVHQFERLVVPVMPFRHRHASPWACAWLGSLFPEKYSGPEKIFIPRRGVARRRLVNENELEKALQAAGFVSIQPERYPVAEQARLFSSAKCVVASHGAGLVNLVFAPASTLLVELFHPDYARPSFKNIAASSHLRYAAVIGHCLNHPSADHEDSRFEIEIPKVLAAITNNLREKDFRAAAPGATPAAEISASGC